ncbi:MAG TPA: protein-disulfide reductase DsbD domain-containing protein [Edaphocola sp.]|nr:protein-disulfide reductase DsbD domain-containing protein [Edaphocola sp.]
MKQISLILLALFSFALSGFSGDKKEVVTWQGHIKHLGENNYQVEVEAVMEKGFHIWAIDAGGDGSLINTEINFEDNNIKWLDASWKSNIKPKTETYEFIDGAVHYYENKVVFQRKYVSPNPSSLNVKVTYQTCNESMCFPPQDVFLEIKTP